MGGPHRRPPPALRAARMAEPKAPDAFGAFCRESDSSWDDDFINTMWAGAKDLFPSSNPGRALIANTSPEDIATTMASMPAAEEFSQSIPGTRVIV